VDRRQRRRAQARVRVEAMDSSGNVLASDVSDADFAIAAASAAPLSGFRLGGNHWTDGTPYASTGDISTGSSVLPGTGLAEGEHMFLTFDSGFTITHNANYLYCNGSGTWMVVEPVSGQTIGFTALLVVAPAAFTPKVSGPPTRPRPAPTASRSAPTAWEVALATLRSAPITSPEHHHGHRHPVQLPAGATNVTHTVTVAIPNAGLADGENVFFSFGPDFPFTSATASCTTQTSAPTEGGDDYLPGGEVQINANGTCSGTLTVTLTGTNPVAGTYSGVLAQANSNDGYFLNSRPSDIVITGAAPTLAVTDSLSDYAAGASAVHTVTVTLPDAPALINGEKVLITFPTASCAPPSHLRSPAPAATARPTSTRARAR